MFNLLVVDDNRSEREGVKFLIDQFDWNVNVAEADSGESALAFLEHHEIDILLTDIKMKSIDGLQLAERVKEALPSVKVIFMSAYGEFEYARRAIDLNAIQYILKPVEIGEFMRVVSQVIRMCEEERVEKENWENMQEMYGKGLRFEKQKVLYDHVHGRILHTEGDLEDHDSVIGFSGFQYLRMIMLDTGGRFFDRSDFDMEQTVTGILDRKVDMIHLNERQSLLFYEGDPQESEEELQLAGGKLIEWIEENNSKDICVIFSGLLSRLRQIPEEYAEMETILANRFFLDGGAVLFTGGTQEGFKGADYAINIVMEMIELLQINNKAGDSTREKWVELIDIIRSNAYYSENLVKYVCSELLKSLVGNPIQQYANEFLIGLEKIHNATTLSELRQVMISVIESSTMDQGSSPESHRKVIEDVVRMIEHNYSSDISLESIAGKVYLSPAYLSRLFKKYKGKSIIKYITSLRLEKAEQLLLGTNKKITDIGQEVGYYNFAYFSALFKNHYGMTPSRYREEQGL